MKSSFNGSFFTPTMAQSGGIIDSILFGKYQLCGYLCAPHREVEQW